MENSEQKGPQPQLPKLKIFQTIQKQFATVGISPNLAKQRYPLNGRILRSFMILGANLISNMVYVLNDAKTFAEYTQSIYINSTVALINFYLIILILKVENFFKFIDSCDSFVNITLKYSASRSIFDEANQFEEKLSKIVFFVMVKMTPVCIFVPWSIYIYFIYFTTDVGNDIFKLPRPMWFPFDWKNPFGFLIANFIQYIMILVVLMIGACLIGLRIGFYLYAVAGSKCIKESLFSFNRSIRAKTDKSQIMKQLIEFVQHHSRSKQLIEEFSDIFQYISTILFVWSLITMCGALLMIQLEISHHRDNFVELMILLVQAVYAFGVLLIDCEIGQRVNLAFEECNEIFDQFEWYLFPTEIQRMLPLVIQFEQKPIEIKCFGSVASDRETFKYLIKTAFSNFTVLRQLH